MTTVKQTIEEREVMVPLNEDEARTLMVELAQTDRSIELLEDEKKEQTREFKERIEIKGKRQRELVGIIIAKQQKVKKPCRVVLNFGDGKKYVFSPFDDQKIIAVEPLSESERQMQFPMLAAGSGVDEPPSNVVEAEIVLSGRTVICAQCGGELPFEESDSREIRDEEGELVRTEFLCRGPHRKGADGAQAKEE